jgi:hypothetical protein
VPEVRVERGQAAQRGVVDRSDDRVLAVLVERAASSAAYAIRSLRR